MWLEYRQEEKEAKGDARESQGPWVMQDCAGYVRALGLYSKGNEKTLKLETSRATIKLAL